MYTYIHIFIYIYILYVYKDIYLCVYIYTDIWMSFIRVTNFILTYGSPDFILMYASHEPCRPRTS